jgi:hypothetical protein
MDMRITFKRREKSLTITQRNQKKIIIIDVRTKVKAARAIIRGRTYLSDNNTLDMFIYLCVHVCRSWRRWFHVPFVFDVRADHDKSLVRFQRKLLVLISEWIVTHYQTFSQEHYPRSLVGFLRYFLSEPWVFSNNNIFHTHGLVKN